MRRNTWIALAVFIVLGGVALYVRANPPAPDDDTPAFTPQPTLASFLGIAPADVVAIRILKLQTNESTSMERDDPGGWQILDPETPVELTNTTQIETAVAQVSNMRVLTAFETVPALGQIGLDTPDYIISLTLEDGEELEILVGATTPTGTGYYLQAGSDDPVAVGNGPVDSLLNLLHMPPILEPTPELEATQSP
ncbi:MAG: DUF4340 domain-containing protein [Chloroflexi bacterium]|nr:MAG: DUF4340 domain-containing protein [Chloroflexota bacterium]MBL1195567.1 DUF4340 domain-containing protein [Chloroflexota bacterium]NOH12850.1 DUF4340 domain-containing protein [Chloroflexota bacterium]